MSAFWCSLATVLFCGRYGAWPVEAIRLRAEQEPALANQTNQPTLHFMFLLGHRRGGDQLIKNVALWRAYFKSAPRHMWRLYAHCAGSNGCDNLTKALHFEVVPQQASQWCSNLVDPMNGLLRAALSASGHKRDKFIWVSGTHVPVKPLVATYDSFTSDKKSLVSFLPSAKWRRVGGNRILPKHSQWMVLGHPHAKRVVEEADRRGAEWNSYVDIYVPRMVPELKKSKGLLTCTDEYWHANAIWGPLKLPGHGEPDAIELDFYRPGKLSLPAKAPGSNKRKKIGYEQGVTTTFMAWPRYKMVSIYGADSDLRRDWMKLQNAGVQFKGQTAHQLGSLSAETVKLLFESKYFFARKVSDFKPEIRSEFIRRLTKNTAAGEPSLKFA